MAQTRNFSLVTYASEPDIISILDSKLASGVLRGYAFGFHDRDLYDRDIPERGIKKGDPKEPHTHIVLRLYNPSTIKSVLSWFARLFDSDGNPITTLGEFATDFKACFRYLIHADHPDRAQYDSSIIRCSDESLFQSGASDDTSFLALQAMYEGHSLYEIARIYGRDFIFHYSHLRTLLIDIREQEARIRAAASRCSLDDSPESIS